MNGNNSIQNMKWLRMSQAAVTPPTQHLVCLQFTSIFGMSLQEPLLVCYMYKDIYMYKTDCGMYY